MKKLIQWICIVWALNIPAFAQRVVVLTPDVADVVVALGMSSDVVGKPMFYENEKLSHAKTVGMHRSINPENVIEVKPDLVLGSYMTPTQSIFEQLQKVGISAHNVIKDETIDGFYQGILETGQWLHAPNAQAVADQWKRSMSPYIRTGKRYILSYNGQIVAGRNTVGDVLIRLAGGVNAADSVDGFKPMAKEAWLAAKPDIVIIAEHHRSFTGDADQVAKRPELTGSEASRNKAIYFWPADDYLRFGFHSAEVVERLHRLAQ